MKKALSLVLALIMVFSIIPMVSMAATTVTAADIYTAAVNVQTFIEKNKYTPATVTVGGNTLKHADFTLLMFKQVDNLANGSKNTLEVTTVTAPENPTAVDTVNGTITLEDYAAKTKTLISYVDTNKTMPNFATIGTVTVNYCNLMYMYAKALAFYKTNSRLPNTVALTPWKTFVGTATATTAPTVAPTKTPTPTTAVTTTNSMSFTLAQITTAATTLKKTIESKKAIPATLKIGSYVTATPTFLRMMAAAICNINDGSTSLSIYSKAMQAPEEPTALDTTKAGNIQKAAYVKIADNVYNYFTTNSKAPNYASTTANGELCYSVVVYAFARILAYYKANSNTLPSYVAVQAWKKFTTSSTTTTTTATKAPAATTAPTAAPTATTFTLAQVKAAAATVKSYVASKKALPSSVTINSTKVSMPNALYIFAKATYDLTCGKTTNTYKVVSAKAPSTSTDSISGTLTIYKSSYKDMAKRVVSYMDSNSKTAPTYCTYNSSKVGYKSLIYAFARILAYHKTNGDLPNYVSVTKWSSVTSTSSSSSSSTSSGSGLQACPSGYEKYTKATTNCQVNNSTIKSVSKTARGSATTQYKMAFNIFNYLQAKTSYWYAYYNTKLGALATWNKRKGNCCDLAHMLIAVWRASGVPARYYHGQVTSSSGGRYGHVWAQCYISGKWYHGDLSNNGNTLRTSLPQSVAKVRVLNGTYITLPF